MNDFSTTYIVQGALWTLVAFSVVTWVLIVVKAIQHIYVARRDRVFSRRFWSAPDLAAAAALQDAQPGPKARLAQAGFGALSGSAAGPGGAQVAAHDLEHSWDRQELLERHLRQQIQKERRSLESGLAVLASIGSTAPFVGLFGTVFGIIHALTAITHRASASIDVVAGPIGEALVATGIGIAVAVPAVLAYNFFLRRLKVVNAELDDYATDLINLTQRSDFRLVSLAPSARTPGGKAQSDTATGAKSGEKVFA
ncbi:MotA/TolQ/ExbB proton channel family protein [Paraburkholderia lycopersici]|uniref:Biopolymer transport protein ExbB n=1 Tax=Paraburkholderia lycopersici TaxID=416944 RepID=A0A1G6HA61_9BURK|nr:MotA/TolQ/ExbB proton channel family protein [Paraburkholderia lycopersici]SDB91177.1 biopolymer transport protein ExbB [Paraburkholderia lycopersici]